MKFKDNDFDINLLLNNIWNFRVKNQFTDYDVIKLS